MPPWAGGRAPTSERFGGSKAQREVIEQTLLYALDEAGRSQPAEQLVNYQLDRPMR